MYNEQQLGNDKRTKPEMNKDLSVRDKTNKSQSSWG